MALSLFLTECQDAFFEGEIEEGVVKSQRRPGAEGPLFRPIS